MVKKSPTIDVPSARFKMWKISHAKYATNYRSTSKASSSSIGTETTQGIRSRQTSVTNKPNRICGEMRVKNLVNIIQNQCEKLVSMFEKNYYFGAFN